MDTKKLRQKILDLAIRGKLVPQDPNDEPASVLLGRIREEKKQMVKDGRLKAKDVKNDTIIFKGEDNLHYQKQLCCFRDSVQQKTVLPQGSDNATSKNPKDSREPTFEAEHYYEIFQDGTVKDITDEIPFDVPEGWEWERLSNIASFSGGKTPSTSKNEFWNGDVLWITSKDMKSKYITSSLVKLSREGAQQMQLFSSDTVLIVARSGILRHTFPVAILKKNATINQDIKAVCLYDSSLAEWVYSCFKGMEGYILTMYTKSGTTVENINFDEFQNILLPIPSNREIKRITSTVQITLNEINSIDNDRIFLLDTIEQVKSHILNLAIKGKLAPQNPDDESASVLLERIRAEKEELIKQGKLKRDKKESIIYKGCDNSYYDVLPNGWSITTLENITTPQTLNDGDWILSENMVSYGDVKLIQLGSIGIMEYVKKDFKYLTKSTFEELNCTQIYPGYLLINRIVSNKMNACIIPAIEGILITTVDTCWISPNPTMYNLQYILFALSSPTFQEIVLNNSAGTTRKRISKNNLIRIPFPIPPLSEQERIVQKLTETFHTIDNITRNL